MMLIGLIFFLHHLPFFLSFLHHLPFFLFFFQNLPFFLFFLHHLPFFLFFLHHLPFFLFFFQNLLPFLSISSKGFKWTEPRPRETLSSLFLFLPLSSLLFFNFFLSQFFSFSQRKKVISTSFFFIFIPTHELDHTDTFNTFDNLLQS